MTKLDLYCITGFETGLFGSAYFLGWVATLLILPPIADKYGRKKIFQVGMWLNLVVFTVVIASTNYWLTIGGMFAIGILTTIRVTIGYTYYVELIPLKHRTFYSTLWICSEGAVNLWSVIYFTVISKHWFYLVFFGYLLNIVGIVVIYHWPESPVWCVKKGLFTEAEESLQTIATFNKQELIFKADHMESYHRDTILSQMKNR